MFFSRFSHRADISLLLLRLALAAIFLYHGLDKWKFWGEAGAGMPDMTAAIMKFLSVAEPIAGIALVLGALTQCAASGLVLVMLGAIYYKMFVWKTGFQGAMGAGWEFDLILLAGAIAVCLQGAGKYSLDVLFRDKKD